MPEIHEHLEHAEHAEHLASDPFNQRVAVSVAIVAALLAGISMLGHRKHNEVLQLQGDANRLQTEANILNTKGNIDHTHATDQWGFYQAKNIRQHMYSANIGVLDVMAKDPAKAADVQAVRKKMKDQVDKYQSELPEMEKTAKTLTAAGEKKQAEAMKRQEAATDKRDESHHAHHQANWLDWAHLGAEIGIVLCSLALLTKRRAFWFAGLLSAAVSVGLVVTAFTIEYHPHPHDAPGSSTEGKGDGHGH